ncbi:hypothetical protein JQ600_35695 [Bradyrhizobium sp. AUGA SZCCT0176]|uniref:hypothetical protein n=1 Tax=Bradyrhizobium sp. AUGA SZCCT0176 TaxID=2807664 RepID=UPI001BA59306|nr:hypothetical protein [Bradyrhizobium sp. AUGA SZCCT0176]MBR1230242.1 hypothetical protein [Bradyrhizobium sp. AUGA SZCCT0176]
MQKETVMSRPIFPWSLCDRELTESERNAQFEMRIACLAWVECSPERRPTPEALGKRIADIADGLKPDAFCVTCHSQPSLCICLKGAQSGPSETDLDFKTRVTAHLPEWQRRQYLSQTPEQAAVEVARERKAMEYGKWYESLTTAEKCALQGDAFLNDYD